MSVPGLPKKIKGRGLMLRRIRLCLIANNEDPCHAESILEETCDPKIAMKENWNHIEEEMQRRGYATADYLMKEEESFREKYKDQLEVKVMKSYPRQIKSIPLDLIDPNPFQPRLSFGEKEIEELANSIKENRLIQRIIVRKAGKRYQIVIGERRFRACQKLGLKEIEVEIVEMTDEEAMICSLIENVHRKDLSTIEKGHALYEIFRKRGFTASKRKLAKMINTVDAKVNWGNELTRESIAIHEIIKSVGRSHKRVYKWLNAISVNKKILDDELIKPREERLNSELMHRLGTIDNKMIQKKLYDKITKGEVTTVEKIPFGKVAARVIKAAKKIPENVLLEILEKPSVDLNELEDRAQGKKHGSFSGKIHRIKMSKVETKMIDLASDLEIPYKRIEAEVLNFLETNYY